ncbi:hypothetical protein [Streptomyces sp. IB201691-2A2]|uniref:hypothetical protein n=1 Tax=Streptomyces sp. IB201691-2A2 TaxID=2561920 RepID=UPI00117FC2E9|nr:hypothetical protein [Streptomyces sp. IB201691-2A2]TRO58111.1 hypothetical protein E4K73_39745 [Streptomyces sp. IB201691-2A2]
MHQHIVHLLGADFQIGLRDADAERVVDVIAPTLDFDPSRLDHDTAAYRTFTGPSFDARAANTTAWGAADLGAANGHGNALSVAAIFAPIARSGAAAHGQLPRPDTIGLVFDEQSNGVNLVNGLHLGWGIG